MYSSVKVNSCHYIGSSCTGISTAITGACGKPGPGASGLGDDPELFNTEGDLSLWKNCEGGGGELVGGFSSFVIESMANFPMKLEVFLLPEGPIWDHKSFLLV